MDAADIPVDKLEVILTNDFLHRIEGMLNEGFPIESIQKALHLAGASLISQLQIFAENDDDDYPTNPQ